MERALGQLMRGIERVLAFALLATIALNFANVIGRYVFGRTLVGADELQTYAMVWIAFLGAAVVAWHGEHLRMDIVVQRFPSKAKTAVHVAELLAIIALVGFALWQSVRYVESMLRLGANSPTAQIPMWLPHSGVAAGLALILVVALWRLARRQR
ncbi:MAG: TRAP transporter small permease [Betaproteobacteria bacterium]|nr:MAG: TRAP transporter small permease [Betaproteobacteria bacterium]